MRHFFWLVIGLSLSILACGKNSLVTETNLEGYDQGKKTAKIQHKLYKVKLENGKPGYRWENLVHLAKGSKLLRKTTRTAFFREDFTLFRSEKTFQKDAQVIKTRTEVEGGQIHIHSGETESSMQERVIEHVGPVFIDLHPAMYTKDVPKPGQSKSYPLLLEDQARIASVLVRFIGPEQFYENQRSYQALHYQIQDHNTVSDFDDYFIDPESKRVVKIQFGKMKFIEPP